MAERRGGRILQAGGSIGILALQAPTIGLALLAAHLVPDDYSGVAAAINVLTFLSALDLGAGVLLASRMSLEPDAVDDAPVAALVLTLTPPMVGLLLFAACPPLVDGLGLDDLSVLALVAVCAVAGIRSCLLLAVIALGTLEQQASQAAVGVASAGLALIVGAALLIVADAGLAGVLGGLATALVVLAVVVRRSPHLRQLTAVSWRRRRRGLRLARASGRLSVGRTMIQLFSATFVLADRSFAIDRLSRAGFLQYDLASRILMLPRQAAAATAPLLIHRYAVAADDGERQAADRRRLHGRLALACAVLMPLGIAAVFVLSPSDARTGAAGIAALMSVGQFALVQSLPVTTQLNASRKVLREAIGHGSALALLLTALVVVAPTTALSQAVTVGVVQVAAYTALTLFGAPRREAQS